MGDALIIEGNNNVRGHVTISGSKNASLPLLAASLLSPGISTLNDVPQLSDIDNLCTILQSQGVTASREGSCLRLETSVLQPQLIPGTLSESLRASLLVLGPLVGRCGAGSIAFPGGCRIGARPIDLHLEGLEKLGARIRVRDGVIYASAPVDGLQGAHITLHSPSVMGTMNIMMAACLATGTTVISNAARELEVVDLACCLVSMGAVISGVGTDTIVVQGVATLKPYRYTVMKDRIEAGTFLVLGAMVGSPVVIHGARAGDNGALIETLRAVGARIELRDETTLVVHRANDPVSVDIQTGAYPLFPTDLQPLLMALLCMARGTSRVKETVFESRFSQAGGLRAMGGHITVDGQTAVITGPTPLIGACVQAQDLRASATLVVAAVAARDTSVVLGVEHLDRGYERLEKKLRGLGIQARRVEVAQKLIAGVCIENGLDRWPDKLHGSMGNHTG